MVGNTLCYTNSISYINDHYDDDSAMDNDIRRISKMKERKYRFIVISDSPKHPVPRLKVECMTRRDIPKDIVEYIMSLESDYFKEEE